MVAFLLSIGVRLGKSLNSGFLVCARDTIESSFKDPKIMYTQTLGIITHSTDYSSRNFRNLLKDFRDYFRNEISTTEITVHSLGMRHKTHATSKRGRAAT